MIEETRTKLKKLGLTGLLRAWDNLIESGGDKKRTIDELLAYLVDGEFEERYERKVSRNIQRAKLRYRASVEEFETSNERGLEKVLLNRLSECEWVKKSQNIIITGATGTGKSFLACALGHAACVREYRSLYYSSAKLLRDLRESQLDHSFGRLLKNISRHNVLIIDDFGLEKIGKEERRWLLEVLEERYGRGSTIMSSQFPIKVWAEIIGDPTIADAIIDRLIHKSQKIELAKEKDSRRAKHD